MPEEIMEEIERGEEVIENIKNSGFFNLNPVVAQSVICVMIEEIAKAKNEDPKEIAELIAVNVKFMNSQEE